MPHDLKDALERAAAENKRSLTAEIVGRLENSFAPAGLSSVDLEDMLATIRESHRSKERTQGMLRHWLASHVLEMFEAIPASKREEFRVNADLAEALQTEGAPGLERIFSYMTGHDEKFAPFIGTLAEIVRSSQGPWIGMRRRPGLPPIGPLQPDQAADERREDAPSAATKAARRVPPKKPGA